MVVDRTGSVCQPKTRLSDAMAFTPGDDIVRHPDGSIVWASAASGAVRLVRLVP
jgi:hypothetical protein